DALRFFPLNFYTTCRDVERKEASSPPNLICGLSRHRFSCGTYRHRRAAMKRYKVTLEAEERQHLHDLIAAGQAAARKLVHARILLKADAADGGPDWPDWQIADALGGN